MDDFNTMLEKAFYDENEQGKLKNFLEEQNKVDPNVRELQKMFPALVDDTNPSIPEPPKVPEYKQDASSKEDLTYEERARTKKPSQNQRLKSLLQEKEQQIAALQRANDELVLKKAYEGHAAKENLLRSKEQEVKELQKIASDELYRKQFFNAQEQIEEANLAEMRAMNAVAEKKIKEQELAALQYSLRQESELINAAYNEYQYKDYSYKPQYEIEDNTPKAKALDKFLDQHKFLDHRYNNPNFSPRISNIADDLMRKLEDRYKVEGRGHEVHTDAFFQDLSGTLKENLRNEFNLANNNNQMGKNPYNSGDGLNMNRYSNDYSAPVTPSRRPVKYTAPMNDGERKIRANFINAAKSLGIDPDTIPEQYDQVFNTLKQSI